MGTVSNSFMANVLTQVGAPASTINEQNLQEWQRWEGGNATWNPLNCIQPMPGSTNYNTFGNNYHVQNYPTEAIGEQATVETLLNTLFPNVLVKLRASAPLYEWNDPNVLADLTTWGSVGFVSYIQTLTPPPPPPVILDEEDIMFLATAGVRGPGSGADPRGNGAVYLVSGDTKRWVPDTATMNALIVEYGAVQNWSGAKAFDLDRLEEGPAVKGYVQENPAGGFTERATATPDTEP